MGIICPLSFLFRMNYRAEVSNGLIEDEIVHVFGDRFDGEPTPDPLEVSDWCWRPFDEVELDVNLRPDISTVWSVSFGANSGRKLSAFLYDPARARDRLTATTNRN
jgi:isopentenyldiphosphate isomerase